MKTKLSKLLFASAVLFAANKSNAQASATATATATIITPISISKTADMNFGNLAVTASSGTAVLAPAGTITATGGVTKPNATSPTAASFTVSGDNNRTYSITLPTSVTLTNTTGTGNETMTASSFTSSPTPTGTLSGSGSQTLNVGATLAVSGNQVPGVYVSGNFTVTVNYN